MDEQVLLYIEGAPEDQREVLRDLASMIEAALPQATVSMDGGGGRAGAFPVWSVDGEWRAGLAWRKKGPMLYIMAAGVLDRHEKALGKLRSGRSCLEYRASKTMTLEELRALAERMLGEAGAA